MNNDFILLGDTRGSDQVIRINVPNFSDNSTTGFHSKNDYLNHAIFIHEWSHYIQFSTTPIGIIISKLRRENLFILMRIVGRLKEYEMPRVSFLGFEEQLKKDFEKYRMTLEYIKHLYSPWPEKWYNQVGLSTNILKSVEINSKGLIVCFENTDIYVTLPLGVQQIFESWAWLEEQIHTKLHNLEINYLAENLMYTWPIHLVISKMGISFFEDRKLSICMDMLGILIATTFYDKSAWEYKPFNTTGTGEHLLKVDAKISKIIYQIFRNYPYYISELDEGKEYPDVFEKFMRDNGLPPFNKCIKDSLFAVEQMMQKSIKDLEEDSDLMNKREGTIDNNPAASNIDQLSVSYKNLKSLDCNLYKILIDPFTCANLFEPPIFAQYNGQYYEWGIYTGYFDWEGRDFQEDFDRLFLRKKGYTLWEHIAHQLAYSKHLACYGSPYWKHPIEPCDHVEKCLKIKNKTGIGFCMDDNWKTIVSLYVDALDYTYNSLDSLDEF